ncbi:MAG: LysR family transcriptional regulator [Alphaproteobacteria bacterium]|nr:LysR family transcriptional regulator [Alphaproteobacteria bacterium]MBV9861047.1 LysR family transcriptional regulator [Alphaproteobacteria bacterium]
MDANDLRVFETVARLGSMNRAAAALHTVQSNVTSRIKALEEDIGCVLFYRHSRGVSLTAAGQRLLPYAARAGLLLSEALSAARDEGEPRGLLTIGSLETTAALRLAPLLARYAGAYPEVDLVLRTGTTRELIDDVLEQRVDGAYVCGPAGHPALREETAFREELVILASPGVESLQTVLRSAGVRIVVLRSGCSYRQMLETLLARRGIPVQRFLEFGTLEAIFGCVAAGLGISLLPRALIGAVCATGRLSVHTLPPTDAMVETVFVRRRDRFASSALRAFLDCARGGQAATEAA